MAKEDLNIYLFVKEFGTAGQKKEIYWEQGYKWSLFRIKKSVSALRSRYRFYIQHLTHEDSERIINYILRNPVSYNNFISTTSNHKSGPRKWHSIQNSKKINIMKVKKTREEKVKFQMESIIRRSEQLLKGTKKDELLKGSKKDGQLKEKPK